MAGLLGFLRLYADPATPPPPFDGSPTSVTLDNPHSARSVLAVDGAPLGEVVPRGTVTLTGLAAGPHTVSWTTPSGFTRAAPLDVSVSR